MVAALKSKADIDEIPDKEEEIEVDEEGFIAEESEDEDKTEKQIMKERVFGERRSTRQSIPPNPHGYFLNNSSQIKFS